MKDTHTPTHTQVVVEGFKRKDEGEGESEGSRVGEWWNSASGGGILGCMSYGRSLFTWLRVQTATTWPAIFGLLRPSDRTTMEESLHEYPSTLKSMAKVVLHLTFVAEI